MTCDLARIPVLAAPAIDPGSARIEMTLPVGMTVGDIVAAALPGLEPAMRARARVVLVSARGSAVVHPERWHSVRPREGVRVVIRLVPGKNALRAVLSIVVAVAAVALAAMWGPGLGAALGFTGNAAIGVGGALVGLGVNLLGALLINALIPPVKPEDTKPSYTLSGWRNRLDPDGAVPVVLGQTRYAPPFAARSYTEIVGDRQYVRALFVFGEGPLSLSDFRIGETSLADYDEVEIEVREGLSDDAPVTLYPQQVLEEQIGVDLIKPLQRDDQGSVIRGKIGTRTYKRRLSRDEWEWVTVDVIGDLADDDQPVIRTTGADAASANVILAFPAGLARFDDDGERRYITIHVRIEQRLAGADEWQFVTELAVSARTTQAFYRQHSWSFPTRGRWQIRCTMLSVESDDDKVQMRTVWAALQTFRPEYPIDYPHPLALVAMRVKATHQLSGALDNFSALVARRCLDWDQGTGTWIERPTSNPASLYRFGSEIGENTMQPPAPRFSGVSFGASDTEAAGFIFYSLVAGSGLVSTASFEIDHRAGTSGSWTTVSIPAANGGGSIEEYSSGDTVQIRARAISTAGITGPRTTELTLLVGGSIDLPAALDDNAITITPLLGGALIQLSTGDDALTARIQIYRADWDLLHRETDAIGAPHSATPLQAISIPLGDTTRSNLVTGGTMTNPAAWDAGAGWAVAGGLATHTHGTADVIGQSFETITGKWYRLAFTVTGRTAGTVTPRLSGGSTRPGLAVSGNGEHLDRIQAVTGNTRIEFLASADFDGSITGVIAYLETAACLSQGEQFVWLEPQNSEGVPGSVSGPFSVLIV